MRKRALPIFIISLLSVLAITIGGCYFTYSKYFYPRTSVKSINDDINLDTFKLASKFLPNDVDFSITGISIKSDTTFNEEELTDLFLLALKDSTIERISVKGIKVDIDDSYLNVYAQLNYRGIPLEGKLAFSVQSLNEKCIFHYEGGTVGLFNIKKDTIFKDLTDNSIVHFDKTNGDIILSFNSIKQLSISEAELKDDKLKIQFTGRLTFWD